MRFHVRPQYGVHPRLIAAPAKAFVIGDHVLVELGIDALSGRRHQLRLVHPVIVHASKVGVGRLLLTHMVAAWGSEHATTRSTDVLGFVTDFGTRLVGGCCGTTGEHIRQVVAAVHSGWRGIIAGVTPNAIEKMGSRKIFEVSMPDAQR